ncbi:chitinase-3-like protein 2 isoform X2 [Ornithodoros turicata]
MSCMFACIAGSVVTLSMLIGTVGYYIVNTGEIEPMGQETHGMTTDSQNESPGIQYAGQTPSVMSTVLLCYWNSSSITRSPPKDYDLNKLCAHCCTHIIYLGAHLKVNADGPHLVFPDDDRGLRSIRDLEALKSSTPGLKLHLSLPVDDVWGAEESNSTLLMQCNSLANRLAQWLPQHGFDGVELDWDHLPMHKKLQYTRITKLIRRTLRKEGLQIMVRVHPRKSNAYDINALYGFSDFLVVHPFAQDDKPKVAVPPIIFKEDLVELCEVSLSQLRNKHRVILALPLFGYAYRLRSIAHYELRAPVRGPSTQGPYTDTRGVLAYFEICFEFTADIWVSLYDKVADCKIAVNRDKSQWIGYDNKASILNKVLFAKQQRMGGVAVYTVDMDDYDGDCGQKNVLLNQVYNALKEMDRQPSSHPTQTPR